MRSGGHFTGYGPRAKRVLFLSATPLEETYQHVWNQLDVFGLAKPFPELRDDRLAEDQKKQAAAKFLIRRVTSMRVADEERPRTSTAASGGAVAFTSTTNRSKSRMTGNGWWWRWSRRRWRSFSGLKSSTCRSRSECSPPSKAFSRPHA